MFGHPDYLGPKQFSKMAEGSGYFACAYIEIRFNLGHLYCCDCVCCCDLVASKKKTVQNNWNWPRSALSEESERASGNFSYFYLQ